MNLDKALSFCEIIYLFMKSLFEVFRWLFHYANPHPQYISDPNIGHTGSQSILFDNI